MMLEIIFWLSAPFALLLFAAWVSYRMNLYLSAKRRRDAAIKEWAAHAKEFESKRKERYLALKYSDHTSEVIESIQNKKGEELERDYCGIKHFNGCKCYFCK